MKVRQIISGFLMVILTVLLLLLIVSVSVYSKINSKSIINVMNKSGYFDKSKTSAEEVLNNYLPKEKTTKILEKISVTSQIKEMVKSYDNNTVTAVANEKKNELKEAVTQVLDNNIDQATKDSFSETVSTAYIKAIFPVSEFNAISTINSKYSDRITFGIVILLVVSLAIYIFLAIKTKTYKWAIISIYNAIVFSGIIYILTGMFENVRIGSINTSELIIRFIKDIRINILIGIGVLILISIFSNFRAYFRTKKRK